MNRARRWLEKLLTTELFQYAELRKMFLTLLLDQFFIFFIAMLSTAMVSSVGEAAMAAVSLVNTVNGLVSLMFTSLATGGAIVVSRAKGSGDYEEIRRAIGEVTSLCTLIATLLSTLLFLGADTIVRALYADAEPLVIDYAVQYMRMMSISFIPFSVFNAIFNIFRNLGDTRSSLMLTVVINVAHLLLSMLFINGLGLGVAGSGYSYIAARAVGMALALFWLLKAHNEHHVRLSDFFHFSPRVTKDIFSLGMPLAVESMLLQGGMLLVNFYLAKLSTMEVAAHGRASSMLNLYNTSVGALTALASTVCGQCFGAKRYDLIVFYEKNLVKIGRLVMLATTLILYPLTPLLMKLYSVSAESAPIIYECLAIAAVGMPLLMAESNLTAMTLRVAGDGVFTGTVAVAALALGRCLLGYTLTIPLGLGVKGIWIAMVAEWLLRTVAQNIRLRGTRWLHKKKEA